MHSLAFQGIMSSKTQSDISISSKHVLAIFDDGHGVFFAVATGVEGVYNPAVFGGAVAQQSS